MGRSLGASEPEGAEMQVSSKVWGNTLALQGRTIASFRSTRTNDRTRPHAQTIALKGKNHVFAENVSVALQFYGSNLLNEQYK